jgi:hypothetical protein
MSRDSETHARFENSRSEKIFLFSFRESEMITIRLARFHPHVLDLRLGPRSARGTLQRHQAPLLWQASNRISSSCLLAALMRTRVVQIKCCDGASKSSAIK